MSTSLGVFDHLSCYAMHRSSKTGVAALSLFSPVSICVYVSVGSLCGSKTLSAVDHKLGLY